MITWYIAISSVLASFVSVGLRGFQQKNVQGNHYRLVFVTSYGIVAGDVVTIGFAAKYGWIMALPAGTGAAMGMVMAMWLHNRYIGSKTRGT
jgi:hypothetical protein